MDARLDYFGNPMALKFVKHINSAGAVVHNSALPAATQELVKLRASQINGCGFCTDMHTKDARHAGESQQRLDLVAAWREATVFTEAERAVGTRNEISPKKSPADSRAISFCTTSHLVRRTETEPLTST